jgi:hypothetical protein
MKAIEKMIQIAKGRQTGWFASLFTMDDESEVQPSNVTTLVAQTAIEDEVSETDQPVSRV